MHIKQYQQNMIRSRAHQNTQSLRGRGHGNCHAVSVANAVAMAVALPVAMAMPWT